MDFSIFFKNLVTFVLIIMGVEIAIVIALRLRRQKRKAKPQLPPSHQPRNATLPEEIEERVRQELEQGRRGEAIRLVRTLTGWGLKESKEYVEALEDNPGGMPIAAATSSYDQPASIEGLPQQVAEFLQNGNKIGAVKAVREATGWGLKESKDYVDQLQGAPAGNTVSPQPPVYTSQTMPAAELPQLVNRLLQEGNKIGAIKAVRAATGWGLREAKEHVDRIEREQGY